MTVLPQRGCLINEETRTTGSLNTCHIHIIPLEIFFQESTDPEFAISTARPKSGFRWTNFTEQRLGIEAT